MKQKTMRQSSAPKKTRVNQLFLLTLLTFGPFFCSCSERIHVVPVDEDPGKVPVTISVNNLVQPEYARTKAMVDVGQVCSNLSFCIYPSAGETFERMQINQKSTDADFGTVSRELTVGVHKIVVVAHNGDKNATMTDAWSISFGNNTVQKLTDTFCWAGEVNVTKQTGTVDVSLVRATAMFRLNMSDDQIPSEVAQLQFAYKGGSAAVNPFNLEGTTKSSQKETFIIQDHQSKVFEVYTFPRYEEKNGERNLSPLEITITAYDESGTAVKERVLKNVPVVRNRITECTGYFFDGGSLQYSTVGFGNLQVEPEWAGTDQYVMTD